MLIKESPVELRKVKEVTDILIKAGIGFVPIPYFTHEYKTKLLEELYEKLEMIEKENGNV